jgi:hypothetical protein
MVGSSDGFPPFELLCLLSFRIAGNSARRLPFDLQEASFGSRLPLILTFS